METENNIGRIEMSGKSGDGEIQKFLTDYATFRSVAAEQVGPKEENILCLYKLFVQDRNRRAARGAGGNPGYKRWGSGSGAKWNEQPASERQKGLIRKLVDRGRVKFEGGTSIETLTRKSASGILDSVFGKRA